MKNKWLIILLFCSLHVCGQEEQSQQQERQLESLVADLEIENEDDDLLQQIEYFRKHRIDLNSVEEDELKLLMLLTDQQIVNFIQYRKLFGKIIDLYELQAVPGWDVTTIKRLLPFISISNRISSAEFIHRFTEGQHSVLFRTATILEKSKAYGDTANGYKGNRHRLLFRYTFRNHNLLQYGITGEKDPGEQFFKGAQAKGFDFYSFHFFARKMGIIKALAMGDFTLSMGQGLVQWQSMAFKKGADAVAVKRQSPVLKPYTSSGEFNFLRGIGMTIQQKRWQLTVAGSSKKIDANLIEDSVEGTENISSMIAGGLHRTDTEIKNKNQLRLNSAAINISFRNPGLSVGINGILHALSAAFNKKDEPYNNFSVRGTKMGNLSVDYSYNYRNAHVFGEIAMSLERSKALLCGLLMSVHERADLSFIYRSIDKDYQTLFGNAFTKNSQPGNESGFYTGVVLRPIHALRLDAYADFFAFPWLKYQVDAPSGGKEFMFSADYKPSKKINLYGRYRFESKKRNGTADMVMRHLESVVRKNWRLHLSMQTAQNVELDIRTELNFYKRETNFQQQGFLVFAEMVHRLSHTNIKTGIRLQYFETDGYDTRIYSFEKSILFDNTVAASYDSGFRFYLNAHFSLDRYARMIAGKGFEADLWLRFAQTVYSKKDLVGSGSDAIEGNKNSELKFQLTIKFAR